MRKLLLIMVLFLMVGSANAYNEWLPISVDPNFPVAVGNWNVAANWTDNVSFENNVPTTADEVRFADSTIPCVIDVGAAAVANELKVGDNGANDTEHVLTILGSMTTYGGTWCSAGYNRASTINVERGASVTTATRIGVGLVATSNPTNVPSYLNVNGGLVTLGGNLQIGTATTPTVGHIGIVNVNSGTLEAVGWDWRDEATPATWSFMDISHGTVVIGADVTADVTTYTASGGLTAYGGAGTINASYDGIETTITATDPLARSPEMDEVVAAGAVTMTWDAGGASVQVYFDGALVATTTDSSFAVGGVAAGPHNWQVDDGSVLGDTVIYFEATTDQPPKIVMDTLATATWMNEATPLVATVTDDGVSAASVAWTSSIAEPNVIISGELLVDNGDGTLTATANATCDYFDAAFTVTATVSDAANPNADDASVAIECAEDACAATRGLLGEAANYPGDIDNDCDVDINDLLAIADDWTTDYNLLVPELDNR